MNKSAVAARWVAALVAAGIVYAIVARVMPMFETKVPGMTPRLLALNVSLLATAAGLVAGSFAAPRAQLRLARRLFFLLGMLTPLGRAAYEYLTVHTMTHDYLAMLGGAFAGGMLGLFVMILPKGARQAQPRRFG